MKISFHGVEVKAVLVYPKSPLSDGFFKVRSGPNELESLDYLLDALKKWNEFPSHSRCSHSKNVLKNNTNYICQL